MTARHLDPWKTNVHGLLVLFCLLLLSSTAAAQTAGDLLKQCIQHYAMADFPTSLKACQRAAGMTKDPKLLARIHLYTGLNQMGVGKKESARKAFTRALTHDPGLTIKSRQHKKAIVALFEEVKKSRMGLLSVKADRAGALVFVDGKKVGTVPFKGSVPVGKHWLIVRTPDGKYLHEMSVNLTPGNNQLVVSLKPVYGYLSVISEPPGAEVLVNGQKVGQTPIKEHILRPGQYKITLQMEGRGRVHRSVKVQLDKESSLSLALTAEDTPPDAVPDIRPDPADDAPAAPEHSFWKRKRIWTWVAAGTAVVAAGVGLGLGLSACPTTTSTWRPTTPSALTTWSRPSPTRSPRPTSCSASPAPRAWPRWCYCFWRAGPRWTTTTGTARSTACG